MSFGPKNKRQIRVGSVRTEDSSPLLYFSVIGRCGSAGVLFFFGCVGEYSFLPNTERKKPVAAEHLSERTLLMECPRSPRLELNMPFGGVSGPSL